MVGVDASEDPGDPGSGEAGGTGRGPRIVVPEPSVVTLVGPSGSGKSSFARRHFAAEEILSSDAWRATLSGREANQGISVQAFAALYAGAAARLAAGGTAVIDATNLAVEARGEALDLAWQARVPVIALAFDLPLEICLAWNEARPGRQVAPGVVRRQHRFFQRWLPFLDREGFDAVHVIRRVEDMAAVEVVRQRLDAAR